MYKNTGSLNKWFTNFGAKDQCSSRLICFPFSGGGANLFRPWASKIEDCEIVALSLPGRENRFYDENISNLNTLLDEITPLVDQLMDKPCVFFGHSLGALIAFELAQRLRIENRNMPMRLVVSAFRSPERLSENTIMHSLADADFLVELKKYGGTAPELVNDKASMECLMPMLRADFKLHETYRYRLQPKLSCPITAFCGDRDNIVDINEMKGWKAHTSSFFSIENVSGNHFFVTSETKKMLELLNREMDRLWGLGASVGAL